MVHISLDPPHQISALADLLLELRDLKILNISENSMDDHTFEVKLSRGWFWRYGGSQEF